MDGGGVGGGDEAGERMDFTLGWVTGRSRTIDSIDVFIQAGRRGIIIRLSPDSGATVSRAGNGS